MLLVVTLNSACLILFQSIFNFLSIFKRLLSLPSFFLNLILFPSISFLFIVKYCYFYSFNLAFHNIFLNDNCLIYVR